MIFLYVILLLLILIFLILYLNVNTNKTSKTSKTSKNFISNIEPNSQELVVAVCNEDISWIDKYSNKYKLITVYNKCGNRLHFNSKNIKIIYVPNIGSCDYAFLSFIIDRYDTLPQFVEFTKGGSPANGKYYVCQVCDKDDKEFNNLMSFYLKNHKFYNNPKMSTKSKFISSGYENMKEWIKSNNLNLNMYKNNICNIFYGGHFGTTKQNIRKISLSRYIALRNMQKYHQEEVDHFIERTWGPLLCNNNNKKHFLSVLAIFKNEKSGMKEWIEHYMNEGVEHFYMIDNGSTDNWEREIEGKPVTYYSDPTKHSQKELYNKYFLDTIKNNTDWIMIVDLDEFIYSPNVSIADTLLNYNNNIGVIKVRWKMFGSNGKIEQPNSVIKGFTTRKLMHVHPDPNVKCIIKTSKLKKIGIHESDVYETQQVYEPEECTEESLKNAKLHLNHYAIQSLNWFKEIKMSRGSANHAKHENVRNLKYFNDYDWNHITDLQLSNKIY